MENWSFASGKDKNISKKSEKQPPQRGQSREQPGNKAAISAVLAPSQGVHENIVVAPEKQKKEGTGIENASRCSREQTGGHIQEK